VRGKLDVHDAGTNEEGTMSGSNRSIEELVMSSARGFLYGHPQAWDFPRSNDAPAVAPATPRGRLARMLAARRGGATTPVAAEAGGCA